MSGEPLVQVPGATIYKVDDAGNSVTQIANGDFIIGYASSGDNAALIAQVGAVRWPLGPSTATLRFDDLTYSFQLPYNQYDDNRTATTTTAKVTYYYCLTLQPGTSRELIDLLQAILASGSAYHDQAHLHLQPTPPPAAPTAAAAAAPPVGQRQPHAASAASAASPTADLIAAGLQRGGQLAAAGVLAAAAWTGAALVRGAEVAVIHMQPARAGAAVGERQAATISPEAQARLEKARAVATKAAEVSGRAVGAALSVTAQVAGSLAQRIAASDLGRQLAGGRVAGASAQDLRKVGSAGVLAVEAVYDSLADAARLVLAHSHTAATRVVGHKYGTHAAQATGTGFHVAQSAVEAGLNLYKLRPTALAKKVIKGTATNVVLGRQHQQQQQQQGPAAAGAAAGGASTSAAAAAAAATAVAPTAAASTVAAVSHATQTPPHSAGPLPPAMAAGQAVGTAAAGGVVDGVVVMGPVPAQPAVMVDYYTASAAAAAYRPGPAMPYPGTVAAGAAPAVPQYMPGYYPAVPRV